MRNALEYIALIARQLVLPTLIQHVTSRSFS